METAERKNEKGLLYQKPRIYTKHVAMEQAIAATSDNLRGGSHSVNDWDHQGEETHYMDIEF